MYRQFYFLNTYDDLNRSIGRRCYGHQEFHVGLFKFKSYLERVFPLWDAYPG